MEDYTNKGFSFITHSTSKKGKELSENQYCSICFYWDAIDKQVRVEGKAVKIPRDDARRYFFRRPFNVRVGFYVSNQSKVIENKQVRSYNFNFK